MSINKIAAERNQRALMVLVGQPGNDVCADCKSLNPRWASHSLGIFICMSCASIHRKMGTHISKVKSLTMDTWSKEQVEFMKSMGNAKSNAHYNPDETKHPPPTNMIDQERDSDLEKYIRSKYQYKSFVTRSAQVAALLGPSRSASSRLSTAAPQRSATMLPSASSASSSISKPSIAPALTASSSTASTSSVASVAAPAQSQFQPHPISNLAATQHPGPQLSGIPTNTYTQLPQQSISIQQQQQPQPPQQSSNLLWDDLAQLQASSTNSSLPLQFASLPARQPIGVPAPNGGGLSLPNPFTGLSASPNNPFPSSLGSQPTGMGIFQAGGPPRSMSLNSGISTMSLGSMPSPAFQPQPGLSNSTTGTLQTPLTAPSPSPFVPSSLPSAGFPGSFAQQPTSAASSSFRQPLLTPQAQPSPMFQPSPQPSPMFQPQPQPSPMYPSQPIGVGVGMGVGQPMTPQLQMGNPFALSGTPQPFGTPQTQAFAGSPSPAPFMQQQQQQQPQQMFGQGMGMGMGMGMGGMQGGMPSAGPTGAFSGTGWGQQPGFAGQQPWGGM